MSGLEYTPKVGQTVIVCDRQEGHQFELGERITIIRVRSDIDGYKCSNGKQEWWLSKSEFEKEGE